MKEKRSFMEEIRKRPSYKWYRLVCSVKRFLKRNNFIKCNHEGSIGEVGSEKCFCLDCHKVIKNEEWEIERKILKTLKKAN